MSEKSPPIPDEPDENGRKFPRGSEQWKWAWENAPHLIGRELPPELRDDPSENPQHPLASSSAHWVPDEPRKRSLYGTKGSPWN